MPVLLNEYKKLNRKHYSILLMSWAGWVFDFYNLILYTFLMGSIKKDLNLTDVEISLVPGLSLAATAIGGILFKIEPGIQIVKLIFPKIGVNHYE